MAAPDPHYGTSASFGTAEPSAVEADSASIQSSFEVYARVLESMTEGVSVSDDRGYICYTNPAEDVMFGYDRGGLVGRHVSEQNAYQPDENLRRVNDVIEKLKEKGYWTGEWLNRRADDSTFTTFSRITSIEFRGATYFVCVQEDVSDYRRAVGDLLEHEQRLKLMVDASGVLLDSPKLTSVLQKILSTAQRVIDADAYAIWRHSPPPDEIWRLVMSSGLSSEYETASSSKAPANLPPGPIPIEDVEQSALTAHRLELYRREGIRSFLAVPLRIQSENHGNLVFYYRSPRRFSGSELSTSEALGNLAAAALRTSDLYGRETQLREAAEASQQRTAFLANAGQVLASSLDVKANLRCVVDLAVPAVADWAAIDMLGEQGFERVAVNHIDSARIRELMDVYDAYRHPPEAAVHLLDDSEARLLSEIPEDLLRSWARNPEETALLLNVGLTSCVVAPIKARDRTLGLLTLVTAESGRVYGQPELELIEELARRAATAIENAALYAEARASEALLRNTNEELLRLNNDLKQFAYSASHDLQEPIRMVSLYTQLLARRYGGVLGAEASQYIRHSLEGARRMELLVNDLIIYTQATELAGQPDTAVSTQAVVGQVCAQLRDGIGAIGATFEYRELPCVRVHQVHVYQIFQNLISNSLKYRSEASPVISITAERSGEFWAFRLADNGIGIPAEYREQVFGLFKRLHSTADYPGTGIGLALCRRIVERYGGRIGIEPNDGPGTVFEFLLPA